MHKLGARVATRNPYLVLVNEPHRSYAITLQDAYMRSTSDEGAALQQNARSVVQYCDHLRGGHDLWAGRLRQLKSRVASLEQQSDWATRHKDAAVTKTR